MAKFGQDSLWGSTNLFFSETQKSKRDMSVSSDRQPTEKQPKKSVKKPLKQYDLRSGKYLQQWSLSQVNWLRSLLLITSDILGLAIAWKTSLTFNQVFSPLPPALNWGVFGLNGAVLGFCGGDCDWFCLP
jgi:hypothetical protein